MFFIFRNIILKNHTMSSLTTSTSGIINDCNTSSLSMNSPGHWQWICWMIMFLIATTGSLNMIFILISRTTIKGLEVRKLRFNWRCNKHFLLIYQARNGDSTIVRLILKDVNDNAPEMPVKGQYEISEFADVSACPMLALSQLLQFYALLVGCDRSRIWSSWQRWSQHTERSSSVWAAVYRAR